MFVGWTEPRRSTRANPEEARGSARAPEAGGHSANKACFPDTTGRRSASVRRREALRWRGGQAIFQAALARDDACGRDWWSWAPSRCEQSQQLSSLARGIGLDTVAALRRSLAAGEVLFRQGDEADALYFVSLGRLAVCARSRRADAPRYVERGGCVGELALVRRGSAQRDGDGDEPTEVLAVPRAAFEQVYRGSEAVRAH